MRLFVNTFDLESARGSDRRAGRRRRWFTSRGLLSRGETGSRRATCARPSRCAKRCGSSCSPTTARRSTRRDRRGEQRREERGAGRALRGARRRRGSSPVRPGIDGALGRLLAIVYRRGRRDVGAAQGVPRGRLRVGVLRLVEEPIRHVVRHGGLRQPREGPRVPRAPPRRGNRLVERGGAHRRRRRDEHAGAHRLRRASASASPAASPARPASSQPGVRPVEPAGDPQPARRRAPRPATPRACRPRDRRSRPSPTAHRARQRGRLEQRRGRVGGSIERSRGRGDQAGEVGRRAARAPRAQRARRPNAPAGRRRARARAERRSGRSARSIRAAPRNGPCGGRLPAPTCAGRDVARARAGRLRRGGVEHRALRADRAIGGEAVVAAEERVQDAGEALYSPASCEDRAVRAAVVSDLHLGLAGGRTCCADERVLDALVAGCRRALTSWCCSATWSSCASGRSRAVLRRRARSCGASARAIAGQAGHDRARQPRPPAGGPLNDPGARWQAGRATRALRPREVAARWRRRGPSPTRACGYGPTCSRPTATTSTCTTRCPPSSGSRSAPSGARAASRSLRRPPTTRPRSARLPRGVRDGAAFARRRSPAGSGSSVRIWRILNGRGGRAAELGLGAAIAGLNRAGLGPLKADLSAIELREAGLSGMRKVIERLGSRRAT